MATIQELSAALVKADRAGNIEDALVLANAIRELQATHQPKTQVKADLILLDEGSENLLLH